MNRKNIFILILLIILNSCTTINDKPQTKDSVLNESEKRCGDGVCDGPENIDSCKEDCLVIPLTEGGSEDTPITLADENNVLAQIFFDIQVKRTGGVGNCGQAPWGVDNVNGGDFSCVAPKYWYNYELSATALQNLEIIPSGNGKWTITGLKSGGGTYQSVSASSDGQRICEPEKIIGNVFKMNAEGSYQDNEISITFQSDPAEIASWACDQGAGYERETTLLLIDWGVALTENYSDLSFTLSKEEKLSPGVYQKNITSSMNPSPENRDTVELSIEFKCMESQSDGIYNSIPCPWE